jgi:hypothetical protein
MKAIALNALTLAAVCWLALAMQTASADPPRNGPSPHVITKAKQPVGTPHKASSFAPHHTNRTVFGDPIQGPILTNVAPKTASPPK